MKYSETTRARFSGAIKIVNPDKNSVLGDDTRTGQRVSPPPPPKQPKTDAQKPKPEKQKTEKPK